MSEDRGQGCEVNAGLDHLGRECLPKVIENKVKSTSSGLSISERISRLGMWSNSCRSSASKLCLKCMWLNGSPKRDHSRCFASEPTLLYAQIRTKTTVKTRFGRLLTPYALLLL